MQIVELQLPSFFDNFDPRAAAANFPSSNWPIIVSQLLRISNLGETLEALTHFSLPILDMLGVQAYLAGLTFALAASPCSTPVLATLLGYVATSKVL